MKKKELLQKSTAVAAVVLAAAFMDAGNVQAASVGANSESAQVVEQSVETEENGEAEGVSEENSLSKDSSEDEIADSSETQKEELEEEQQEMTSEETEEAAGEKEAESSKNSENSQENENVDPVEEEQPEQDGKSENTEESENKNSAVTDESQTSAAGWIKNEDGSYSYRDENGNKLQNCVVKIDDKYYGFGYDERLYQGRRFSIWNSQTGEEQYYEAKEDGSLYTDEWHWARDPYIGVINLYYYGADGSGFNGIKDIEGKNYYFRNGIARTNCVISVDGKKYTANENGALTEIQNDGWNKAEGYYYYLKNGEELRDCIEKIGEQFYGFDDTGKMYADEIFGSDGKCYCAADDGHLKINTWVKKSGKWYYFGEDGAAYQGVQEIAGETYYFGYSCEMVSGEFVEENGKAYLAEKNGIVREVKNNSWVKAWENWYYILEDGTIARECVQKIGKNYYVFDDRGRMQEDEFYSITVDVGTDGHKEVKDYYYFARKDGTLAMNCWLKYCGEWYYFGEDGDAAEGVKTINGSKYYFDDRNYTRVMQTSGYVECDGISYVIGSDGKLQEISEQDGWSKENGSWYYIKDRAFSKDTVLEINGVLYGFDRAGKMYSNEEFDWNGESYFADKSGALYRNRWRWGRKEVYTYYDEDGKRINSGVKTIRGKQYLFQDGILVQNSSGSYDDQVSVTDENGNVCVLSEGWNKIGRNRYYVNNGMLIRGIYHGVVGNIDGEKYYFDAAGRMQSENLNIVIENEWYIANASGKLQKCETDTMNDETFLIGEDGYSFYGVLKVGEKKYYFKNGYIVKNQGIVFEGNNYALTSKGVMEKLPEQGWKKVDGSWYYVEQGRLTKDGTYRIGNKIYVFSKSGKMLTSKNGILTNEEDHEWGAYTGYAASEEGVLLKNTWLKIYDKFDAGDDQKDKTYWMYFDEEGKAVSAFRIITIKGKKYYLSGEGLYVNGALAWRSEGNLAADANGVLHKLSRNGWSKVGEYWYYSLENNAVYSKIRKIGTEYYAFDENGRMYADQEFEMNGNMYRADTDGNLLRNTSWQDGDSNTYYYDADGVGYEGAHKILNSVYYFEGGKLLKNATMYDTYGNRYVLDSKGVKHTMANNRWVEIDGIYYYAFDGVIQKNTITKINGKYYGFDAQGRMYSDTLFSVNGKTYYAAPGGAIQTGWKKIKETWYYFKKNGSMVSNGWQKIGGKWYYMDKNGVMQTSKWIDGIYYVKEDGSMAFSEWVDGNQYYVDASGKWVKNQTKTV